MGQTRSWSLSEKSPQKFGWPNVHAPLAGFSTTQFDIERIFMQTGCPCNPVKTGSILSNDNELQIHHPYSTIYATSFYLCLEEVKVWLFDIL